MVALLIVVFVALCLAGLEASRRAVVGRRLEHEIDSFASSASWGAGPGGGIPREAQIEPTEQERASIGSPAA